MLHLLVPQSITPLIWAYLVFGLHMPFAPFWPSASIHLFIHSFIHFLIPSKISSALHCCACLLIRGHDTRVRSRRAPRGFRFLLCSRTSSFNKCSKPVKTFACTRKTTQQLLPRGLLQLVLQKVCQIYKWREQGEKKVTKKSVCFQLCVLFVEKVHPTFREYLDLNHLLPTTLVLWTYHLMTVMFVFA